MGCDENYANLGRQFFLQPGFGLGDDFLGFNQICSKDSIVPQTSVASLVLRPRSMKLI